jgi:hypothetical protein
LAIDVAPVRDFYDENQQSLIFNLVDDSINALPDAISLLTREFFAAVRSGLVCEQTYALHDALDIEPRESAQVLGH